ncbi:MAG: Na/Pi cotransporter family protein [Ruminococcaceae bacterium]|nr:Na/Pi cotransporter family protein [Oscillospiraceae bacterium]
MDLFDVLSLIGGLCLFLFGMNVMGDSLEKSAGDGLKSLLSKLTTGRMAGFFTGLCVTSVIQSSSATTVMVVGFVNSGVMSLRQAINVIMGANVGTTVTAWLLSLSGIEGDSLIVQLFKPTSFTPILALIGTLLYMGSKSHKKKDIGMILLGFATLMCGMDIMSSAVSGLKDVPEFRNILTMFSNPIFGVLAGAIVTGIIQSSSASVGILQALSSTGQITIGASIPIIMGQNIGTCVTALLSSVGTNRNARRTSVVHLSFNIIGTVVILTVYCTLNAILNLSFVNLSANQFSIAVTHTVFNVVCTALMLPASALLEKLSYKVIPEPAGNENEEEKVEIDQRLMATPAIAIERCRVLTEKMAHITQKGLTKAINLLDKYDVDEATKVRSYEKNADTYEDTLISYLVKLNTFPMSDKDSNESSKLLFVIGDFERISDHSVNLLESVEEIRNKEVPFSEQAKKELSVLTQAVSEIVDLAVNAFNNNDLDAAAKIEPLEQVIDSLKEQLRTQHISRLQKYECSIEAGFVWADLLTNLERIADHCSNIAGCIIEMAHDSMDVHEYLNKIKATSPEFAKMQQLYSQKYSIN